MERRNVAVAPVTLAADQLGFFRWGRVQGKVIVTNDAGDWLFLSEAELADLLAGKVGEEHPRRKEYQASGLIRDGLDVDAYASRVAERSRHVSCGPHVHVVTLTRRGSRPGTVSGADQDMSLETAEKVVNLAMQSPSPSLTFELQGGEPLRAFALLQHFVQYAQTRNQRVEGKNLRFHVLTTMEGMTEEIAEWLIDNEVAVTTTLDGPADLHDGIRVWKGGASHADTVRWIDYFHRRYTELGRPEEGRVNALLTVTRATLDRWREVVQEYRGRQLRSIRLQPLSAFGLPSKVWAEVGYSLDEYLSIYRQALDFILGLNSDGTDLVETTAAAIASRILGGGDSGAVDLQSPSGDGSNQLVYDVDGRIFPSEEARLLAVAGDPIFELGNVGDVTVSDLVRHPTVRAIAAASLLDAQPLCGDCWNKPYCGFSPVRNYLTQGDLLGQRKRCLECREHYAVSTILFEILGDSARSRSAETLKGWTKQPRHAGDSRISYAAP